ncbi:MAG: DNA-3-methyladenine glycosylase 2 family protein [Clostridia bacterium]|nr:DNA-3-methyladenine glycosylase 2 family protein [Clostridia bacterium]
MFSKIRKTVFGRNALVVSGLGDYSLTDTMECGQCFRYERVEAIPSLTEYRTVVGTLLIDVGQRVRGELIFFDITDEEFERAVRPYFALDTDLSELKRDIISHTDSEWLKDAAEYASGIAILKQDPWEALVSFIISQNNNIPRIRKIIREICAEYGVNLYLQKENADRCPLGVIDTAPCEEKCKKCGRCYTFPAAEDILARPDGLLPSRPGFRYGYILDAAERVALGRCNLELIAGARSYTYTLERLKEIRGVGDKVASCVALFGFANLEAFPIDVWMKRAIDTYFDGKLDPATLGRYAGVAQQYIFHYIRHITK